MEKVIAHVGYDGSKILFPDLEEPLRRRGFMVNEMLIAAYKLGAHFLPIMTSWPSSPAVGVFSMIYLPEGTEEKFLIEHDGVLIGHSSTGNPHAVAWDCEQRLILDPNGTKYPFRLFHRDLFWARIN